MLSHTLKRFLRQTIDAVLPVNCAGCDTPLWGDPIPFFCRQCWTGIRPFQDPRCPRCSIPFPSSLALLHSPWHHCEGCRIRPPAFSQAWTLYPYQSPLKEAIGLFKYHGKISLAHPLANLMLKALKPLPPIDVICPVPLHPDRLKEREYNQSLLLADRLSRHLGIPLSHQCLRRIRPTTPQTSLRRKARLKNLRRSFAITQPHHIAEKNVLLIDDVLTTGTTVNECAKTLRRAGAGHVYIVTLARMV